ncbi:hypothetical protein V9T40_009853 [Parthenolecanium corni]|uniref:Uncharacterized protein n=1 Tax=Parthenolecanium corni TaxID=536013 RepID=A0AAN9TQ21_9HEMI
MAGANVNEISRGSMASVAGGGQSSRKSDDVAELHTQYAHHQTGDDTKPGDFSITHCDRPLGVNLVGWPSAGPRTANTEKKHVDGRHRTLAVNHHRHHHIQHHTSYNTAAAADRLDRRGRPPD